VRHDQDAAVAAATVADEAMSALLADLLGRVAGCFPRRETRQCYGQMLCGLLTELDDHNCWTIAEAIGHRGPHRLQHLLSRAVWDDQHLMDIASAWAAGHLDDGDAVLIVDETADEKSSADCAGAARQYSGTLGGVALCQVAVTLTYATSRGHALIGRALYLPEGCHADEEHRELAGVPEEVLFATKPQLAAALLEHAQSLGIDAAFVAGDEVYGGRELRRSIRERGPGETGPTGCTGQPGDAATSTAPATPTSAGTPAPRQHHHHSELSSAVRGEAPKQASPAVPHAGWQGVQPSPPSEMGQLHQTWHPVAAVQAAAAAAGDAQLVEGIDHGDRPRDGAVLVFGEDAHRLFADLVGHVLGLGEQGHRVGERPARRVPAPNTDLSPARRRAGRSA
jgi:hypothetical protein